MNYTTFNQFIGNENAKEDIKRALKKQNCSNSWLISGPIGIGKHTLAMCYIQDLFANIQGAISRISHGTFSDFMKVTQNKDKDISIAEIRKIADFLSLTPGEGEHRAVIIDNAESMNQNAANALLKVLEEPPKNTIIFLISHAPQKLLPTIKSRCKHVKMHPLSKIECALVLGYDISDEVFEFAKGSPGLIREIIEKDLIKTYHDILKITANQTTGDICSLLDNLNEKDEPFSWYYLRVIFANMMSNLIKCKAGFKNSAELIKIASNFTMEQLQTINETINQLFFEANLLNFDKKHTLIVALSKLKKI